MAAEESKLVSRHKEWFSLAVCCTIALVGLTTQVDKVKDTNQHTKWSVSALSIAVALAAIAVFAHLLKEKFIATHVEGGMVRKAGVDLSSSSRLTSLAAVARDSRNPLRSPPYDHGTCHSLHVDAVIQISH